MSQTGSCGCCGATSRRRSIGEYFDDGRRRSRCQPLPIEGQVRKADDGVVASFSFRLDGDRIAAVSFQSTTCITLVAYCERLCEMVEGLPLREAIVASSNLVRELTGVPLVKQHRAALVSQAFLSAVNHAVRTLAANPKV